MGPPGPAGGGGDQGPTGYTGYTGYTGPRGPTGSVNLAYGIAGTSFSLLEYSGNAVLTKSFDSGISTANTIWLQGYNQTTAPLQPISVSYLYFTSNVTSTWYINMGTSLLGSLVTTCNASVDYSIYYYSY
jgi:hypothetical protein